MFTGIIEGIGAVKAVKKGVKSSLLEIYTPPRFLEGVQLGDSIAVNGICLTAAQLKGEGFSADAMAETMRQTNLGFLREGAKVNLEKALTLSKPMGGHIVSGHVDGTGIISALTPEDNAVWITVDASPDILKYIIGRGSVALDGVSLTAAYAGASCFKVSIIPHTAGNTTLLTKKTGDLLNIECDVLGKYVEKFLGLGGGKGIDEDFLRKNGF